MEENSAPENIEAPTRGSSPQPSSVSSTVADILERKKTRKKAAKKPAKRGKKAASPKAAPNDDDPAPAPKKKVTTPWKPASLLQMKGKEAGWRYRWCARDTLDKKLAEGWEPVQAQKSPQGKDAALGDITLVDGTRLTGIIIKRDLVYCRMPEEMAKSREEYYAKLTDGALQSKMDEFKKDTNIPGQGQLSYGSIKIDRG